MLGKLVAMASLTVAVAIIGTGAIARGTEDVLIKTETEDILV